jgi:nucleoside-diphosphate-sugar epimerase
VLLWEKNTHLFSGEMPILEKNIEKEVCKYSLGDNTQAYNDFQWKPIVSIEEGLIRTIEYTIHVLCETK